MFPSPRSWQLSFNCCAFWAKAKLRLIPNYAAEYYHIVFSKTAHVRPYRLLATLKSPLCAYSKLTFSWERKEGEKKKQLSIRL